MQIWFIIQGSIKEGQDLCSHYMRGWDLHIQDSLTHVSLGSLDSQLVILLILDSGAIWWISDRSFKWPTTFTPVATFQAFLR